jgi:hypothetical protein
MHLPRATIQCAIVGHALFLASRTDLACYTALCLIRSAWQAGHGHAPPSPTDVLVADTGRSAFKLYSSRLLTALQDIPKDEDEFLLAQNEPGLLITYPLRCVKVAEILGLLCSLAIEGRSAREGRVSRHTRGVDAETSRSLASDL